MNSLIKKFIEFALGNGIALILGFISSPIITRLVMPEEFGKFSMFNTVTNLLLIVVMLGLDQSYVRFFYEEEDDNRGKLLIKTIKYPLIVNIILSILLIIFYKPMSSFIIGRYSFFIIVILIIQNTFSLINRFACLLIRMEQKGKLYSLIQVITKLFYIIFVLLLFKIFNRDYRTLVVSTTLSTVIVTMLAIFVEKDKWFLNKQNTGELKTSTKELFLFGMPLILSTAIIWIFQSIDRLFINVYSGYTELGIYSSAFSIISLLNAIQGTFTTFWVPVANEKYKNNPDDTKFFEDINSIISFVMLLVAVLLITSKDLLVLLLGSKYRNASFIFPFLVFMPIMYTISETTVLGINFKKRTQYHIWVAIISALTNIIGNYILVPSMGAKGAAISTGLSYVVFFMTRTMISKKLYRVNYNLRKFFICTLAMIILSVYASLYRFNIILFILGIINILIIFICYKFIIIKYLKQVKFKLKR